MQASQRLGDVSRRILEFLEAENDWVPRENVYTAVTEKVPPGKALRTYNRKSSVRERKGVRELTDEEKIMSGARTVVSQSLDTLQRGGYLLEEDREDGRWIRRREACRECGRPFSETPTSTRTMPAPSTITENVIIPKHAPWWKKTGT